MKVFLANVPWRKPGYYFVRAGSRWPHFERCGSAYMPFPFFLAYATALLEQHDFEVRLVDGVAADLEDEEFFAALEAFAPDLVVYEVSTPSIERDLAVARTTKERLGPDVPVAFCGPHHGMYQPDFLAQHQEVDIVLQGEYEFTLLELATRMRDKKPVEDTLGTLCRRPDGSVAHNARRPLEQDLGKFPWPARHHLPMTKYVDLPGGIPAPSLQLWASRGCPFQCIFCAWPQIMYGSSTYRVRPPVDVVDELEWCVKEYGFQSFYFDDDTFNIGKERILALCREIQQRGIGLPWAIMARADCMDEEMLVAMKKAGLVALKYGVESANQDILRNTGKALDLGKVRRTVRITRELGIKYHLTFTFGLPGETWDTIRRTIDFALELDPDSLQFSIVTPFPGSKYFDMLDRQGFILSKNWDEYDGYNRAVIRTETLSRADLEKALGMANRRWRRHLFWRNLRCAPLATVRFVATHPFHCLRAYFN